jgi:hypothetical protein
VEGSDIQIPTAEAICSEMSRGLGLIHWRAGTDCGDAEWVLAGKEDGRGCQLVVLDWNQVSHSLLSELVKKADKDQSKSWIEPKPFRAVAAGSDVLSLLRGKSAGQSLSDAASVLGKFLGTWEMYFPRPSLSPSLYLIFKNAYLESVNELISLNAPSIITDG